MLLCARARAVGAVCACFSLLAVVGTVWLFVYASETAHQAHARTQVWGEYLRGAALGAAPPCTLRVLPTLLKNTTRTVVVMWETNDCSAVQLVEFKRALGEAAGVGTPVSAWTGVSTTFAVTTPLGPGQFVHQAVVPVATGAAQYRVVMRAPLVARHSGGPSILGSSSWYRLDHPYVPSGAEEVQAGVVPPDATAASGDAPRTRPQHSQQQQGEETAFPNAPAAPSPAIRPARKLLGHGHHGAPAPAAAVTAVAGDGANHNIRVAVLGDSQSGAATFRHIIKHVEERQPSLLVHVGDGVQDYYVPREWHAYLFGPLETSNFGQRVPLVYARGNHDGPSDGPVSAYLAGRYFAFTAGPVRWVVLDANDDSPQQFKWCEKELAAVGRQPSISFVVVVVHIPPFVEYWEPGAWERGEKNWGAFLRERYVPLFELSRVDMVISGHSHIYQRGAKFGVTYIVTGGAGGELESERVAETGVYEDSVTRAVHHYGLIDASRCSLQWAVYDAEDSRVFDAITLRSSRAPDGLC